MELKKYVVINTGAFLVVALFVLANWQNDVLVEGGVGINLAALTVFFLLHIFPDRTNIRTKRVDDLDNRIANLAVGHLSGYVVLGYMALLSTNAAAVKGMFETLLFISLFGLLAFLVLKISSRKKSNV
jgi:hypothetical protein